MRVCVSSPCSVCEARASGRDSARAGRSTREVQTTEHSQGAPNSSVKRARQVPPPTRSEIGSNTTWCHRQPRRSTRSHTSKVCGTLRLLAPLTRQDRGNNQQPREYKCSAAIIADAALSLALILEHQRVSNRRTNFEAELSCPFSWYHLHGRSSSSPNRPSTNAARASAWGNCRTTLSLHLPRRTLPRF